MALLRLAFLTFAAFAAAAQADYTNNILITGYWPPTNEMVRQFSQNPDQNPSGWQGGNWEGRGYNVHSFFPEFPNGIGRGEGDFEVDYQDTSEDWWRITNEIKPVAIITFSRGSRGRLWEVEMRQRNLEQWGDDYDAPFQPTPSPPDDSVPAGHIRESTLPMQQIVDDVNSAGLGVNAFIDDQGFGGGFLSEFIAYHGTWYQSIHSDPKGESWNIAAGHIHVGTSVSVEQGTLATEVSIRTLTTYLDTVIPGPGACTILVFGAALAGVRRRH